ncbi:MAG: TIGR01620 family protein [Azospirillum sp.]|nr:TIGR01620 family protein [Azospirillum sp.]
MTETARDSASWLAPMELDPGQAMRTPVEATASGGRPGGEAAAVLGRLRWPLAGSALVGAIAAMILLGLAFDAANLLQRAFAAGAVFGALVVALIAVAVGTTLKLALDEWASLRRLRRIEGLRSDAERLGTIAGYGEATRFADSLAAFYVDRPELVPAFGALRRSISDAHDDGEVVRLIDRQVLAPLDHQAYRCVVKGARDIALATALCPSAALDVAIVLWRNLRLVREVATLYGARPGQFGSIRLMKRMLTNLAVAGVAESAQHVAVDALGGNLAAAVSTRLGQGMINGLLTARIGIAAMHLCRPIAFSPDNQPSLRKIRSELMSVPRQVL